MVSKTVVLVVVSVLPVILIYSSVAQFDVFARPKHIDNLCRDATPTIKGAVKAEVCCQIINGNISVCTKCQYDANDNTVGSCINFYPSRVGANSTNLPTPEGNAYPPAPSNDTGKLPLGSIFKVPPGTTNALPSLDNNTGGPLSGYNTSLPTLSITKEHNPASPNVFSSVGNTTNPNNNTSTLKLSPLEGKQHHHKGSNIAGNNLTKSIQGHSHVTVQNNG